MRIASILLLLALGLMSAQAQTLADAARQARENKPQAKKASPIVYTDETLTAANGPNSISDASAKPSSKEHPEVKKTTPLQWKAAIATQKNVVVALQSQIEKAEKSIQFVTANGYANGPQYNAAQKRKQDQVELAKPRLEQEKQKLEALKEAARRAGFGSSVYDQ